MGKGKEITNSIENFIDSFLSADNNEKVKMMLELYEAANSVGSLGKCEKGYLEIQFKNLKTKLEDKQQFSNEEMIFVHLKSLRFLRKYVEYCFGLKFGPIFTKLKGWDKMLASVYKNVLKEEGKT